MSGNTSTKKLETRSWSRGKIGLLALSVATVIGLAGTGIAAVPATADQGNTKEVTTEDDATEDDAELKAEPPVSSTTAGSTSNRQVCRGNSIKWSSNTPTSPAPRVTIEASAEGKLIVKYCVRNTNDEESKTRLRPPASEVEVVVPDFGEDSSFITYYEWKEIDAKARLKVKKKWKGTTGRESRILARTTKQGDTSSLTVLVDGNDEGLDWGVTKRKLTIGARVEVSVNNVPSLDSALFPEGETCELTTSIPPSFDLIQGRNVVTVTNEVSCRSGGDGDGGDSGDGDGGGSVSETPAPTPTPTAPTPPETVAPVLPGTVAPVDPIDTEVPTESPEAVAPVLPGTVEPEEEPENVAPVLPVKVPAGAEPTGANYAMALPLGVLGMLGTVIAGLAMRRNLRESA